MTRLLLALLMFPVLGAAQSVGAMFGGGYGTARIAGRDLAAGSVTGGASFKVWRIVGFGLGDTHFYKTTVPPAPQYRFNTIAQRCQDTNPPPGSIGFPFVTTSLCSSSQLRNRGGAKMTDVNLLLSPLPVMAGAGYRFGESATSSSLYASAGYAQVIPRTNGIFFARVLVGRSVSQFQAGMALYIGKPVGGSPR
jgi:hypothetical protein